MIDKADTSSALSTSRSAIGLAGSRCVDRVRSLINAALHSLQARLRLSGNGL
jgi:hypothetical protein